MSNRFLLPKVAPEAYQAMIAFDKYQASANIDPIQRELIKIRASQINGCAYCVDKHNKDARDGGETEQRLYAVSVWKDTPFFTPEERAILALTEEVTLIQDHVSDETWNNALGLLGEKYLADVLMAIITINAWNRIGIATGLQPAKR